jgi:hypothetical protein
MCRAYLLRPDGTRWTADPTNFESNNASQRWQILMERASLQRGRPLQIADQLSSFQTTAGLQDVREEIYELKVGGWPEDPRERELGKRYAASLVGTGTAAFTMTMFVQVLGWKADDVRAFVPDVDREIMDDSQHRVMPLYVVWSRKGGADGPETS